MNLDIHAVETYYYSDTIYLPSHNYSDRIYPYYGASVATTFPDFDVYVIFLEVMT